VGIFVVQVDHFVELAKGVNAKYTKETIEEALVDPEVVKKFVAEINATGKKEKLNSLELVK